MFCTEFPLAENVMVLVPVLQVGGSLFSPALLKLVGLRIAAFLGAGA